MNYKLGLSFICIMVGSIAPNLALVLPSNAENKSVWRSFSPAGAGFSILMPGKTTKETDTESALCPTTGKMSKKTTYTYMSDWMDQDETVYSVSYSDYAKECEVVSSEEDLKMGLDLLSAMTSGSGVLKRKQLLRLNGHPGVEVRFDLSSDGQSAALWKRAFIVPLPNKQARMYEIVVFSLKPDSLPKTLDGFMKSFKLTNP